MLYQAIRIFDDIQRGQLELLLNREILGDSVCITPTMLYMYPSTLEAIIMQAEIRKQK